MNRFDSEGENLAFGPCLPEWSNLSTEILFFSKAIVH